VRSEIESALRGAGHQAVALDVSAPDFGPGSVRAIAEGPAAVVVIGGDGSVHHALPLLAGSGVPVYQAPLGTENLFSREFGMTRDPGTLVRALAARRVRTIDVGVCEATDAAGEKVVRRFAIMCSLGPDASVVHRLAKVRNGPISHLSYVRPCVEEALAPVLARTRVSVDGTPLADWTTGMLVVANLRQYAMRVDPARDASPDDGMLDVVLMPADSGLGTLARMAGARLRRSPDSVLTARGRVVEIEAEGSPSQIDGEAFVHQLRSATFRIEPGALSVLLPG
jgi:diacylglycerol kinase (ATP)